MPHLLRLLVKIHHYEEVALTQGSIVAHASGQVLGSSRLLADSRRTCDTKETSVSVRAGDNSLHFLLYKGVIVCARGVLGPHGSLP